MSIRRTRELDSYAEYLAWQASKLQIQDVRDIAADRANRVRWFRSRFEKLRPASAVCLGARFGEEVEALRGLGWQATGIDVQPFKSFVEAGDMNTFSGSFDLVYTNSIDHCWDIGEFLRNVHERLRSRGRLLMHLSDSPPGEWETWAWDHLSDVLAAGEKAGLRIDKVQRLPAFYDLHIEVIAGKA